MKYTSHVTYSTMYTFYLLHYLYFDKSCLILTSKQYQILDKTYKQINIQIYQDYFIDFISKFWKKGRLLTDDEWRKQHSLQAEVNINHHRLRVVTITTAFLNFSTPSLKFQLNPGISSTLIDFPLNHGLCILRVWEIPESEK